MSKVKLLLLLISLPLFLGGMFALGSYVKAKNSNTSSGPDIVTPTPFSVQKSESTATLTKESGLVQYKLPEETAFKTLDADEIQVPTGTQVKTGDESLAHVIFPNNSVMSLSKLTEVTLNFEEKKINIVQILGNTWHRVEKVLEGQSYSVETPNALATVRGTEFNVGILPDNGSELYVMESEVDFSKVEKVDGEMKIEETQKIRKDKHIFLKKADETKPLKVVDMPADKKNTAWFKRNTKITEEIKKAEATAEKEAEQETNEGKEPKLDLMKKEIRETIMMKELTGNDALHTELKKIDTTFRVEPTSTPAARGAVQGLNTILEKKDVVPTGLLNAVEKTTEMIPTPLPTSPPARVDTIIDNTVRTIPTALPTESTRVLDPIIRIDPTPTTALRR